MPLIIGFYPIELASRAPAYPEGNSRGTSLLDVSISLFALYPSRTNDLHRKIAAGLHRSLLASPRQHSSPSSSRQHALTNPFKIKVGRRNPRGSRQPAFLGAFTFTISAHTAHMSTGPWFQDCRNGEPTADAGAPGARGTP
ncbi:hypothetical protein FNV43_RR20959 [Rhamnella rubrinervis]|uniref:Uncharacterized protein n=1 Tax=Rhamnella rubrinervis TaxID=2594499 RepID=A0A8K0E258_9ROSA|nr:hypothetical protein FNV43_RR20959 [Rhamnella rubrinervis]